MSQLKIEYCVVCNYYPRAAGLADQLRKTHGIDALLVKGSGGVFEVTWGNELLFSKKKTGRFPDPGEVERILEERLSAAGPS
jgi:selenoprotein W-related protein